GVHLTNDRCVWHFRAHERLDREIGAIVDDDQLRVFESLSADAVKRRPNVTMMIKGGDYDTDERSPHTNSDLLHGAFSSDGRSALINRRRVSGHAVSSGNTGHLISGVPLASDPTCCAIVRQQRCHLSSHVLGHPLSGSTSWMGSRVKRSAI